LATGSGQLAVGSPDSYLEQLAIVKQMNLDRKVEQGAWVSGVGIR